MSNRKIRKEAKRRAAVKAAGHKRAPGPLQALHDMFDRFQTLRKN